MMPSPYLAPVIFLVLIANGTPLMVQKVLGRRYSQPVDGDHQFVDGRPLFGRAKTVRGVACAIAVTTAAATAIGLSNVGSAGRRAARWSVSTRSRNRCFRFLSACARYR